MTRRTLPCIALLLAFASFPACHDYYRSKPKLAYETASGTLYAPYLSLIYGGDGEDDCEPGETETDLALMFRYEEDFSFSYKYKPITRCAPAEGHSRFVQKPVETVVTQDDDLDGCVLSFDFEGRLVGRVAYFAGQCADGDQAAVSIERTAPGTWGASLIVKTGQQIDGVNFQYALGTDAHWDGAKHLYGLTYGDDQNVSRFALFEHSGGGWSGRNIFGPGDVTDGVTYYSPRISGFSANSFVTFQTSAVQFGQPTAAHYSRIEPNMTAQRIAGVGDPVPGLAGQTIASLADYRSLQIGRTLGTLTATTAPSNLNIALEFDTSDSLSLTLRYKKDDPIPDTLEDAAQWTFPSYDGDRLGMRVQTNGSRFAYVADVPNDSGGTTAGGLVRTLGDMYFERIIDNFSVTNQAYVGGVAAYQAGLDSGGGNDQVIFVQDIARAEILRGGASTMFGSDAIAGVMNFVTGPETGFDRIGLDSFNTNYGAATFRGDMLVLGDTFGGLYEWNETLGHEITLGDTGISEGITGLLVDAQDELGASSATAYYRLDSGSGYSGTRVGFFETAAGDPIVDIGDIYRWKNTFIALRTSGEIGEFDPDSVVYTPRVRVLGLPGPIHAATTDGERIFGGLGTGHLIEFLDCLPEIESAFNATEPEVTDIGFGVIGKNGAAAITALAMPVPEPTRAALNLAAAAALGALTRLRSQRGRNRA